MSIKNGTDIVSLDEVTEFTSLFLDDPINQQILNTWSDANAEKEIFEDAVDYFGRCSPELFNALITSIEANFERF